MHIFTVNGKQYAYNNIGKLIRFEAVEGREVPMQVEISKRSAEYKKVKAAQYA